jgi:16S rRNA (uracil1498-N3)-methyltransferase
MHIFYSPHIDKNNFYLDEEESKHAVKVLRLKETETIIVVDGKGGFYEAEIAKADPKKCLLKLIQFTENYGKRNFFIHIAIAPTKNIDRIEWFVEKSVEIGVDKISFIQCQRSERKHINSERIEKIAVSAMKQSLKAYLPQIQKLTPLKDFLNSSLEEQRFIGHLEEGEKKDLQNAVQKGGKYCILIGPEGDFSPEEISLSKSKGFIPVNLGASRLRTETAGMVACHILNLVNTSLE